MISSRVGHSALSLSIQQQNQLNDQGDILNANILGIDGSATQLWEGCEIDSACQWAAGLQAFVGDETG